MTDWLEIDNRTKAWIKEAGERIRESLNEELLISTKANANDLVTNVDKDTERFFINKIRNTYKGHRIVGEEGQGDNITDTEGVLWVIDPIDGTMNFVHMKRNFTISIGIFENGVGRLAYIYDVIQDDLFHAVKGKGVYFNEKKLEPLTETPLKEAIIGMNPIWLVENRRIDPNLIRPLVKDARGIRSFGSAALEMAYVSCGWLDGYIACACHHGILQPVGSWWKNWVGDDKIKQRTVIIVGKSSLFVANPDFMKNLS